MQLEKGTLAGIINKTLDNMGWYASDNMSLTQILNL